MLYTIKKNKHRAWPIRLGLYFAKKKLRYRVCFDQSCKYDLGGEDQLDINKLFGIGYFPNHHKNSARFGWRYNVDTNKIELFAYCYVDGVRVTDHITSIPLNVVVTLQLNITKDFYHFIVVKDSFDTRTPIQHSNKRNIGYPLGIYFGGNKPTPHKIKIKLKKA